MENTKTYLFEEMPVKKAIAKVSIPTVLSMLVAIFYSLADTYFVSLLDIPEETAAVTLVSSIILLFNAINNIFGIGGGSLFSRSLGAKDYKTAKEASIFSIYGCMMAAIILSLTCFVFQDNVLKIIGVDEYNIDITRNYMYWTVILGALPAILNVVIGQIVKGEGNALHASIGMMLGCILNVILDPFFILPSFLNMGAEGAGLATFISNVFACLYYVILLLVFKKGKTLISFDIRKINLDKKLVLGICSVGVPAAIQNILNVTGSTILNNYASVYGSSCVTAIGISHKMCNLSLYLAMGISSGVTPLISYNYASKNFKRMKDIINNVIKITTPMMIIICALMIVFSNNLIKLFMDNKDVVVYGSKYIKEMAIAQPFLALDFTAVGIFQAIGKGRYALIFAILRKVILEIPALFILNIIYPIYGIGYAQAISEIILAIISVNVIKKIYKEIEI